MASMNLCSRMLLLARMASHSQTCCSTSVVLTASAARVADQMRCQATSAKAGGDASKQKTKSGPREGPIEGNSRLQALVDLLSSPTRQQIPLTKKEQDALAAHQQQVAAEANAWSYDMGVKFYLQQAALKALPPRLRELAMQTDHSPFPMNRTCLFDNPPESYRDPVPGTNLAAKAGKGRAARS
ncbi:hypothetical protein Vretimale_4261 [Volvox reticuliferus]|uniref:Uncharacterized protein n=1 Tax=Volvox reticuliferus TaxID=1737510 RepID=A0A8J4FFF0_9CHLO|nr:hypothetical protein Vretifemale_2879 [Volvox reticuliferus]GIL99015.1 hypothetical protein Vretimale_4261 [Volvox reticuliferus]